MIELEEVSVELGSRALFQGLSLSFAPGKLTGVLGPNGSGKTTLLRVAAGELLPVRGRVRLDARDASSLSALDKAQQRGLMMQASELAFEFTVFELCAMGLSPFVRKRPEQVRAAVIAVADQVGLASLLDRSVRSLSGGERQRAHLARVLLQVEASSAAHPALLLDEPASHQDPAWQLALFDLLRERAAKGVTVIAVIHDLALAARSCDELVLLERGALVRAGTVDEVFGSGDVAKVFAVELEYEPRTAERPPRLSLSGLKT